MRRNALAPINLSIALDLIVSKARTSLAQQVIKVREHLLYLAHHV